jgi:nucleoid DNA-binding protein
MTKKEMVKDIADETNLPPAQVMAIVQRVLDGITDTLVEEGRIELRNFGIFEVRKRKPRQARNPKTGATVKVPARLVVSFKAGKKMAQRVRKSKKVPGQ